MKNASAGAVNHEKAKLQGFHWAVLPGDFWRSRTIPGGQGKVTAALASAQADGYRCAP